MRESRDAKKQWWLVVLLLIGLLISEASAKGEIFIYTKPFFSFIFPNHDVSQERPIAELNIKAARNEYEPATFVIYAKDDLKNLSVECTHLRGQNGLSFSKENIDVRIVKVWKQFPPTIRVKENDKQILVPELLVKDDIIDIQDVWKDNIYSPPFFPDEVRTNIPKHTSKQFWVTVKVPEDTKAGLYKGDLRILVGGSTVKTISFKLEVLPFVLPKPNKTYVIYFRGRISPNGTKEYVPKSIYISQLKDIKEHGFNGITVYETSLREVEEAYRRIKSVGFEGPVVQMVAFMRQPGANLAPFVKVAGKFGYLPFFYGQDEPNNENRMKMHITKSREIHKVGGRVVTAITKKWNEKLDTSEPLDWVNFSLTSNLIPRVKKFQRIETYYWQIWTEVPTLHRLYSGFFLWKSGYDGVFPYCYQAFYPVSPYKTDVRPPRNYKVFNVTYPAQEKPISTLQWEAIREGIDDVRYLTLVKNLIDKAENLGKAKLASNAKNELNEILGPFVFSGRGFWGRSGPAPELFIKARNRIVNLIMKLWHSM